MSATTQTTLFDQLCYQLHLEPDHKGECWLDCPNCGKGDKHFSFNEHAGHCFSCDYSASLKTIAAQLNIGAEYVPVKAPRKPQERPKDWQRSPERWLDHYCAALDRVSAWQSYKPLSLDSIARFRLGVGVLPSSRCTHRRLVLPVHADGRIIAFHGRAYRPDDADAKWLTAGGSSKQVLYNVDLVQPGSVVIVCENFVDCILAMQVEPSVIAVAGGGASWRPEWTQQLVARRPKQVICWLDNDLAGAPNPETYHLLAATWRAEHPGTAVPEPRGPRIANELLAAGLHASCYRWPNGAQAKCDIGQALMGVNTR